MTNLFKPLTRSFALASLTGAALFADSRRQDDAAGSRRGHQQQAGDR